LAHEMVEAWTLRQDALTEGEFRNAFERVAVGIAVVDLEYHFLEVNPKLCEIVGYPRDELRALTAIDISHPEDVGETKTQVRRLLAGECSNYSLDKRYVRKDRSIVWCRTTVTLLRDAAGGADRFVGVIEDITARKSTEEALREETRILELLNTTGTAIAAHLDLRALVQTVTDAATQLSGAKFGAFFYTVIDHEGKALRLYTLSGAPREVSRSSAARGIRRYSTLPSAAKASSARVTSHAIRATERCRRTMACRKDICPYAATSPCRWCRARRR
jgi:PAS domain S-box-containing protein